MSIDMQIQRGPCVGCGTENYPLSMGGPSICPACDCQPPEQRLKAIATENRELRAELDRFRGPLMDEAYRNLATAEKRLASLTTAAQAVERARVSFLSSLPYQPPEALWDVFREKLAGPLEVLRAALESDE